MDSYFCGNFQIILVKLPRDTKRFKLQTLNWRRPVKWKHLQQYTIQQNTKSLHSKKIKKKSEKEDKKEEEKTSAVICSTTQELNWENLSYLFQSHGLCIVDESGLLWAKKREQQSGWVEAYDFNGHCFEVNMSDSACMMESKGNICSILHLVFYSKDKKND